MIGTKPSKTPNLEARSDREDSMKAETYEKVSSKNKMAYRITF
jgi:hypothetical protein